MGTWKSRRRLFWLSCAWGRNKIEIGEKGSSLRSSQDWQRILPGLVISAISLAVVFYLADFRQFQTALQLADYRLILAGVFVSLSWLLVRSAVWRSLLRQQASYSQVFFSLNEGYLLNNLLPFRLGEVGRALLLGRKANLGFWQVLSTILIERAMDLLMAAGLLLFTVPFVVGTDWAGPAALIAGSLVLVGLVVLYLVARYRDRAMALFGKFSARWPLLDRLGGRMIPAFLSGLGVLTDGSQFARASGWMVINWGIAVAQYYLLLTAFFPGAQLLWAAFSLGVAALGIAAPSSPGSVGVMELSIVGALSLFGLDPAVALAFALTAHILQYVTTGVLGAYGLSKDGETLTGLYRRLRKKMPDEG